MGPARSATSNPNTVDTGKVKLHVVDGGEGEPALVFVHYWGGSARTWRGVTRVLGASHRCIAYDQRGWGSSEAPEAGYALEDLAGDLSALLEAKRLRRYVLVGHSMGGKVAMLVAAERPHGLEGLVLVAPASPRPQNISEQAWEAQRHAYDNRATAEGAIRFLAFQALDEGTREQLMEDSLRGSPGAKYGWPHTAAFEDISPCVGNIAVPTLVLVGDHDPQDPETQQREELMPLLHRATLRVLPDCGHLAPVEQPEALANAIGDWLGGLDR